MIDPPNGRFPALHREGKELYAQMRGSYKPGQTVFDSPEDFDTLGSLHHPRSAGVDVAAQLQQRHPHHAVPGLRRHPPRDGARGAHHPDHASARRSMARSSSIWESREDAGKATRSSSRRRTSTGNRDDQPRRSRVPALTPATPNLRFTERFTRTANDTIDYQMTVEDPDVLTTGKWWRRFR